MRRRRASLPTWEVGAIAAIVVIVVATLVVTRLNPDGDDCTTSVTVDLTTSPEKGRMMRDLAASFNDSDAAGSDGLCATVEVDVVSSGVAETRLAAGPEDVDDDGEGPVIWTPASSTWATLLNEHVKAAGHPAMAYDRTSIARTPLVIAMPATMAETLGWPDEPVGWSDLLAMARVDLRPGCTADAAPPEMREAVGAWCAQDWGELRLGKTNPNESTSGLHALIAQAYAAAGKNEDLTAADLDVPEVERFNRDIESAVVHYGQTTLTFLDNWYRNDLADQPSPYVSAVTVEEKSVIDYNRGDPAGERGPDDTDMPPRPQQRLVAVYPEEGTIYSDNPLLVLDAEWVSEDEVEAARAFVRYMVSDEVQQRVGDYGFRPAEPSIEIEGKFFGPDHGVDPTQQPAEMSVPGPRVLDALREKWKEQRRSARVLLLIDVSYSMGTTVDGDGNTRLDLAKKAAVDVLDTFKREDLVGLYAFSTGITSAVIDVAAGESVTPNGVVHVIKPPDEPISEAQERLRTEIQDLVTRDDTALYTALTYAYDDLLARYDDELINAVVLLSDGENNDKIGVDDDRQLGELLSHIGGEGQVHRPVRIFTVAYGEEAVHTDVLRQIAEATNAGFYDSTDAASIDEILAEVVSNF